MAKDIEIIDHSREVIDAKNAAIARALEAIGQQAVGDVKEKIGEPKVHTWSDKKHPLKRPSVDTGRLRNSITHQVQASEECVIIGTNLEYAEFVEKGTSRSPAYPFLKPGIEENIKTYKEIAKEYLKGTE